MHLDIGTDTVEFGPEIIENNILIIWIGGNIDLNNTNLSIGKLIITLVQMQI